MKKTISILIAVAFLVLPAAAEIDTTFYENQTVLEPGNQSHVGNLELNVSGETTLQNLENTIDLPFNSTIEPESIEQVQNETVNISINASPGKSFRPQKIDTVLESSSDNQSFEQNISLEVPEYNNWIIKQGNFTDQIVLGENGELGFVEIDQEGNVEKVLETQITGNISEHVFTKSKEVVYPQANANLSIEYDLPDDLEPGKYEGQLVINETGGNRSKKINLSATFSDTESPEIQNTRVEDMDASLSQIFKVKASDNRGVERVEGMVTREVEHSNGNTTEMINQSVTSFEFERSIDEETVFNHKFTDSDEKGKYWIRIKAFDSTGNNDTVYESFKINDLDVVKDMVRNFNYGPIVKGDNKEQEIFTLEKSAKVRVQYYQMTPNTTEANVMLQREGDEAPMPFNGVGSTIDVEETGKYKLVLDTENSEQEVMFNGQLKLSYPEVDESKTADIKDIFFEGELITSYAEPDNTTVENLDARRFYTDFEDGEPQKAVMRIVTDASRCKGFESMDGCLPNANAGLIEQKDNAINMLQTTNTAKDWFIGFLVFAFGGYIAVGRRKRSISGLQKSQYQLDYGFSKMVPGSAPKKWDPKNYFKNED